MKSRGGVGRRRVRLTTLLFVVPCVALVLSTMASWYIVWHHFPSDERSAAPADAHRWPAGRYNGGGAAGASGPHGSAGAPESEDAADSDAFGSTQTGAHLDEADSGADADAAVDSAIASEGRGDELEASGGGGEEDDGGIAGDPLSAAALVSDEIGASAPMPAVTGALAAAGVAGAYSLTIITQTTPDRLRFLREMADRWAPYPLIAAVYIPLGMSADAVEASVRSDGKAREHMSLVLRAQRGADEPYPINELRNLAIDAAKTTHFLTLDVDLWPSSGLHEAFARQSPAVLGNSRSALVVPAFAFYATHHAAAADEAFESKAAELPHTMAELQACMHRHALSARPCAAAARKRRFPRASVRCGCLPRCRPALRAARSELVSNSPQPRRARSPRARALCRGRARRPALLAPACAQGQLHDVLLPLVARDALVD